nr:integrase, catalytic region, zinc finger, CCHC-type, peptidase aspartic, catalytic [Tanacetum cinerariifolium]
MGTFRETLAEGDKGALHLGPERPRVYSDLSPEEKERYNTNIRATNILLQGLPKDIYTIINHYIDAKDIWDNMKMLLEDKMLLMQAQENRMALDEEQLLFITGGQDNLLFIACGQDNFNDDLDKQPVQDLALNVDNVFQADERDAFDFDVDEAPTTQTMFMVHLSSVDHVYDEAGPFYDSDILSEVHDHDNYQDAVCELHGVHEIHDHVQPNCVVDLNVEYTSNSNMILYDQYVKDNA